MSAGSDDGATPDAATSSKTRQHHFTQNGRLVTQIQFLYPVDEQKNEIEPVKKQSWRILLKESKIYNLNED